jgi:hypothetical protein
MTNKRKRINLLIIIPKVLNSQMNKLDNNEEELMKILKNKKWNNWLKRVKVYYNILRVV